MKGIELLTGAIGSGKTCRAMDYLKEVAKDNRPIFVHGIRGLTLEHEAMYCDSLSCKSCKENKPTSGDFLMVDQWHIWAPDGAFLLIDECQHIWRPRASGAKVPDSITAFEMSRHRGIDFLLLSQHPQLFDINIRKLITRHEHIDGNWKGGYIHEWASCNSDPATLSAPTKRNYKPDPKNWDLYISSDKHTKKAPLKKPFLFYVMPVAALVVVFFGYRLIDRFSGGVESESLPVVEADAVAESGLPDTGAALPLQLADPFHTDGFSSFGLHPLPEYTPHLIGYSRIGGVYNHVVQFTRDGWEDIVLRSDQLYAFGYSMNDLGHRSVQISSGDWSAVLVLSSISRVAQADSADMFQPGANSPDLNLPSI